MSDKSKKEIEIDDELEDSLNIENKDGKDRAKIDKPKEKLSTIKPRKWEKRWVMQPNVLDLNQGEIWVQKWVTVESAKESHETIEKIINEMEESEKQQAFVHTNAKVQAEQLQDIGEDPLGSAKENNLNLLAPSVARLLEIGQQPVEEKQAGNTFGGVGSGTN